MEFVAREHMRGLEYIQRFREYLDYLEEHLDNVRRAFNELSKLCKGMWWVEDKTVWNKLRQQVCDHDISKFSKEEFTGYRKAFFPLESEPRYKLDAEWEHHKRCNTHHHESLRDNLDVIHMIIDWTAMSYKFGDTAKEYYENNKSKINLTEKQERIMYEIFARAEKELQ